VENIEKFMTKTEHSIEVSAAARLNRLPIAAFHREIMWLLGGLAFFDFADTNSFSFAAPAVMKAWHLPISTIAFIVSATFMGMCIGAMAGGWFSDQIGRKKALISTALWYATFSLLNAFVLGPRTLFITRLLTGVGLSAMTVVALTYINEMFPAKRRGAYQGWITTIGLCGIPVTAYVARFVIPLVGWGWRLVFVWGSLGLIFALFAIRLEESPRWYESRGRLAEATATLDRIECRVESETGELPPVVADLTLSPSRRGGYAEVISKQYLPRTVVLTLTWILQTLGFFGFTAFVPTLLVAHGFSLVHSLGWSSAMSIATVPGALIAALISDHWDRRWWIAIVSLLIAACGLAYGFTFQASTIIVFGFLVEMFLHTLVPLLSAYTAECYPTEVRTSGAGLTYGIGRLGNVFGPLVIAIIFKHYGYTSVFIYITVTWVLVAITIGGFGLRSRRLL
jgi:putative MFS transporter